ncbi:alkylglycerol monooxygenase isoform X1 [Lingula anatina]|uniref:Alkylglycerol monooxygenase n=1 Tax=Lingula anatina TaxID=7574 RepID=A0A1S3K486_LINAN|nr:alkylglycerol monooxygenase isoform X1 [Lingula anatina]|eukprot:XP_013417440.1 alkylglycerol monooxygenase isoform X1 [Lingula anatina]
MTAFMKVPMSTGIRWLFYAVTPNETSFENVDDVPRYIEDAVPFFVFAVALEVVVGLLTGKQVLRINDAITSAGAGLISLLPLLLMRGIEITGYVWVHERFCLYELPWNSAWTWWLCFIAVDFGYYWFHRMAHEVNFMWASHQTHHSAEDYNLSTALRQSILQRYLSWVFYLPLALIVPPAIFVAHLQFNILYQFWIHNEMIKSLGPLEWILNTPSHHRVHHGRNPYCIDKNYAGTLIIWDRLFGTFQAENEEVVYGLTHPINTFNPIEAQFGYVKYLWSRLWEFDNLSDKVSSLVKGPGWAPGKPRLGNIEDIPKVKAPVKKYDSGLPLSLSLFVLSHYLLVLIGYQELVARKSGLSQLNVACFIAYIVLSLTCFGALFDNRYYAPFLECFRCVLFVACDLYLTRGRLEERPVWQHLIQWYFLFSACLWGLQAVRMLMSPKNEKEQQKQS